MIYSVSIYNKNGKLKKCINSQTLIAQSWENFWKLEKTPKKFMKNQMKSASNKTLRAYQTINTICDDLHSNKRPL